MTGKWKANGSNLYSNNMACEWAYKLTDEYYTASQDYYNLQSTLETGRDTGFKTINKADDLLDLTTGRNVWSTSGKYLDDYLITYAQLSDIPDTRNMRSDSKNHVPMC